MTSENPRYAMLPSHLNPEQREVVFSNQSPLLVIAGAGSGKTSTLTARVARLVMDGVDPERILLCTFTNKAAGEMVRRVELFLGESKSTLWAGTFHKISHRILRTHGRELGYKPGFSILDREDSLKIIKEILKEKGLDKKARNFPTASPLASVFGYARSRQWEIQAAVEQQYPEYCEVLDEMSDVFYTYEHRKQTMNVMDFDDLLCNCHDLLKHFPEVRSRYARKFQHILIDEYQDTNPVQAAIVDMLASAGASLTVVGDDAQSIYSFRGADSEHILSFPDRYPDCHTYYLTKNYRSVAPILELSNHSIAYNHFQFQKELEATRSGGVHPAVWVARDAGSLATWTAQHIRKQHIAGVSLSQIAILYRIHSHSLELQMALEEEGIPYILRSGMRFFEQKHTKDVLAFLRLVNNPADQLAWDRLLMTLPGVGAVTINKIIAKLEERQFSLEALNDPTWQKSLKGKLKTSIQWILRLLNEAHEPAHGKRPENLIRLYYEQEYKEYLFHKFEDARRRSEDLEKLEEYASNAEDLDAFLTNAMLYEDEETLNAVDEEDGPREAVTLSTIHQAKGLEWDMVYVPQCTDGSFPFFRALKEGQEEEERRLFYVACTRAREQLHLLVPERAPDRKRGYGGRRIWRTCHPSRFVWEVIREMQGLSPVGFAFSMQELMTEEGSHELLNLHVLRPQGYDYDWTSDMDDF